MNSFWYSWQWTFTSLVKTPVLAGCSRHTCLQVPRNLYLMLSFHETPENPLTEIIKEFNIQNFIGILSMDPAESLGNLFKSLFSLPQSLLLDKSFSGGHWTSARKCYTPATQLYHWSSTDCSASPVLAIRSLSDDYKKWIHRKHIPSILYASTSDKYSGCSWDLWVDYAPHFFVLWTYLPSVSTTYS